MKGSSTEGLLLKKSIYALSSTKIEIISCTHKENGCFSAEKGLTELRIYESTESLLDFRR